MSAHKHRIYSLLQRTAHRLKIEADTALKEACGLTTAQAAALGIITREGPVSQRLLADTLSQRESAITTMSARLLKHGYITKSRSKEDARAWELSATDKGREALKQMRAPFDKINALLDESFADGDIERMANALHETLDRLETDKQPNSLRCQGYPR